MRICKKCRAFLLTWLFLPLLTVPLPVRAALTRLSVEQVRIVYPEIAVYYYDQAVGREETIEAEAWLDETMLLRESGMEQADQGTDYYLLLDISGSIPDPYFEEVKNQILRLGERLKERDTLTLITFGDEVELRFSDCQDVERMQEVLKELKAEDQTTHLYLAIKETIELSQAEENGLRRQILMVVSDGADVSVDNVTLSEVQREIEDADIPLYALCTDNASEEERKSFGALARNTGGSLTVFNGMDAEEQWGKFGETLSESRMLFFTVPISGQISMGSHNFLLKAAAEGGTEDYTKVIQITNWEKDTTSPEINSLIYKEEDNALDINYTEEVAGAEEPENYGLLASDGSWISVREVKKSGENSYLLYLDQIPPEGKSLLKCEGITDTSMERNLLSEDSVEVIFPAAENPENIDWFLIILFGICILTLSSAVLLFSLRIRRRKPEEKNVQEIHQTVEHIVRHITDSGNVKINKLYGSAVMVSMSNRDGEIVCMELPVAGSTIMGRQENLCDVCIEDRRVSKQHCVLEETKEGILIRDLESKNGVFVNGTRIDSCRMLKKGDLIRLGDTTLRIEEIHLRLEGAGV